MKPNSDQRIYWDSCVFLAYINGDADRLPILDELLTQASKSDFELITSELTKVEVAYAATEVDEQEANPQALAKIDELWVPNSPVNLVEVYDTIAVDARDLIRKTLDSEKRLKPFDAVHIATAVRLESTELHTYDERLIGFDGRFGLKICEPSSAVMQLTSA